MTELRGWAREYNLGLADLAAAINRLAAAHERIANAFEPARESVEQPPARPDVSGVTEADD